MAIREAIQGVLDLQKSYSSANTAEMRARGDLVRDGLPALLMADGEAISKALGISRNDLIVEGRDGTGMKSEVPWVRFASRKLSPNARIGWYVVWLFRKDGAGVYLSLGHASTDFVDGAYVPKPDAVLAQFMAWSRAALGPEIVNASDLVTKVQLGSNSTLATAYQKSCVVARYYGSGALPDDSEIVEEQRRFARLLGSLYEADRLGLSPAVSSPEVRDAEAATLAIANPIRAAGQGIGLSVAERRAVELHAMKLAIELLRKEGFVVEDVSATHSFDLKASRGSEFIQAEVKGTTGALGSILFTANEIALHEAAFPKNALIVIHEIQLIKGHAPIASGGKVAAWRPWRVDPIRLKPLAYSYSIQGQLADGENAQV